MTSGNLGNAWDASPPIPADAEPIDGFKCPLIHNQVQKEILSGALTTVPAMVVGPTVKVSSGKREAIYAHRTHVWSPVFDFPQIGHCRLFLWTQADFWWRPADLDLDPKKAAILAENDLVALEAVTSVAKGLSSDFAAQPSVSAADLLDQQADEFRGMLDTCGQDEEKLHAWLNDPRHHVFLDPHQVFVRSKIPFGAYVSDFVVRRSDGTYLLVEIEAASTPIFRKNGEPTFQFNHACNQIRSWQHYIRENVHTVRNELALPEIYEPAGSVVIGRSDCIATDAAHKNWRRLKSKSDIALFTYDEMCDRVKALSLSLRRAAKPR